MLPIGAESLREVIKRIGPAKDLGGNISHAHGNICQCLTRSETIDGGNRHTLKALEMKTAPARVPHHLIFGALVIRPASLTETDSDTR
jgi:hypothetical protein